MIRRLATRLREADVPTLLYHQPGRVGKQMKFADRAGIPLVVLRGPSEVENGTVLLKELGTGQQSEISEDELVAEVKKRLPAR